MSGSNKISVEEYRQRIAKVDAYQKKNGGTRPEAVEGAGFTLGQYYTASAIVNKAKGKPKRGYKNQYTKMAVQPLPTAPAGKMVLVMGSPDQIRQFMENAI